MSRRLVFGAAAFALLALFIGSSTVAAPTPAPPGKIYYYTKHPTGPIFTTDSGAWSMNGDGTNKQTSVAGQPSRLSHGGRWFLEKEAVAGTYPDNDGFSRSETFAYREDGLRVQLTNDASLDSRSAGSWAYDDSFLSNAYVKWTAVASGGNYTDAGGNQWLATAAIYKIPLDWSTGVPVAGTPVAVLATELRFENQQQYDLFHPSPNIRNVQWSPAGNRVVYSHGDKPIPTGSGSGSYALKVTTFDASGSPTGTVTLASTSVNSPDWAPDGSRIAFSKDLRIYTIRPDGTGLITVTNSKKDIDQACSYSPDGAYLAITRRKAISPSPYPYNVMRVAAGGGTVTDLTGDVSDQAFLSGWR